MASLNDTAQLFKHLHKPGKPLVLTNVYDGLSARAVASLPNCKALATASFSVARANGTEDDELDMETNLSACELIAAGAREFGKPLTVDIQDAYGDQLEEAISRLVQLGVVGVNLEDCDRSGILYSEEVAADRIKRALTTAANENVKDFVVNARCDALIQGLNLSEVISRGKAYLDAGATTVFVWGGSSRGLARHEVKELVAAFGGRLNVLLKLSIDGLTIPELAAIGVARISIGPTLQVEAMKYYSREADKLLSQA
ncbi:hypothetical protein G7Z17_g2206 [Cylindrodendrum hubeiense]|uniref:Uncharacterized protein n=1 Tax=Cylindrodendrum hubeiense TaxID=595255 RepID=A0A9P5HK28_9HYPO|nr:hypothetical protein G7Z17_g2206 [Cylindrodendrum hubeiense]